MASTLLANIYNPLVYGYLIQQKALELNAIVQSGMASVDGYLQGRLAGGGNNYELSDYKQLVHSAPNLSDDSATVAPTEGIDKSIQKGRLIVQNKHWAVKDFAKDLAGQNPVPAITGGIAGVWATVLQSEMISSLLGIMADNIANDAGDMVYTAGTDAVGTPTAAEKISAVNILRAKQTLGDHGKMINKITMHSALFTSLQEQNLIGFIPNSRGEVLFNTFMGYRIVVDDDARLIFAGVNRLMYTCILSADNVIGLASGNVDKPFEMYRDEKTGNGAGEDFFASRRSDAIHPWGFSFLSASVAGASATYAELALTANWNRIWPRKNINIAYLRVNN